MYRAVQRQDAGQPYDTVLYQAAMTEFGTHYSQRTMVPADADTMRKFENPAIAE